MKQHDYNLKDLSALTFQQMRVLGYSENTMTIYRRHYQAIVSFATPRGEETIFSEELMQSYLIDYCQSHCLDTPNGKKRYRETQRFLNMMLDCAVHGAILRHKMRKKTPPESFATFFCDFQIFAREWGISDTSYRRIAYVIEQFSFYLFQKEISDFSEITNDNILVLGHININSSVDYLSIDISCMTQVQE